MLSPLLVLSVLSASAVAATATASHPRGCSCSSGFIAVPVDVMIAADPANPLGLNSTDKRRLQTTFDIFGVLCQPVGGSASPHDDLAQLFLHGQTYTTQYWDVHWNKFQNYSYIAYSCNLGITSFAYDNTGAGRSIRPVNASDCQLPTAASVASSLARDLKSGRVSKILTGNAKKFDKVVGIGHSLGSATFNHAAIRDGTKSPFDALILTGHVHDRQFAIKSPVTVLPAREVDPARWSNLDPGYITTPNISVRYLFYGPNNNTFSQTILELDDLTADAGSRWMSAQIKFTYVPAWGFTAPVVQIVGSHDEAHCLDNGGEPCCQATLQKSESVYWPDSKNFTMIVIEGYGHDLNLGYAAADVFAMMTRLFVRFTERTMG